MVRRNYELLENFEAGIKLSGSEVKSLRQKNGSLKEAYVKINDNEVILTNVYIPPFQAKHADLEHYDPSQPRTLLLKTKEIERIKKALKQKGHTLVPIRIFAKKRFIKIEIAIAKGKQQHDKRQDLKDRATKRDADREMRGR